MYQTMFGRSADIEGLQYWTNQVMSGAVILAEAAYTIAANAQAADLTVYNSKVTAATAFTDAIDTAAELLAYEGQVAAGRTYLTSVVSEATATTAVAGVAATIATISSSTAQTGTTFTLTASADNITGTSANDTITAVLDGTTATNTTFSAADQITGGTGTDTINITLQGGATANVPAASVSGVESVNVRNVSAAATIVAASGFVGATEFVNDRSTQTVEFTNIGTADLTIKGNNVATNGATDFTSSASASVTDALVINLKDGVTAGAITNQTTAAAADTNGDWTSVTINSTGGTATATTAANTTGALALSGGATMQSLTINAATSLTTGAISGWDVAGATTANKGLITITGAGAVDVGTLNAAVEDVVASASTGGVTLTASTQDDFTFVGGDGADKVTTGAVLGTGGSVNAGGGTSDRLTVASSTHITSTIGAQYTNFEQLQVQDGVSVDMDHITGITSVRVNAAGTASGVTDMSAAHAAAVTIVGAAAGVVTLGVKDATTVGQIDTVKITVDDGATANNLQTLTAPVLTGVEKLEITANDDLAITALTSATALDSIVASGAKAVSITTGALATNVNTVVNASALTGIFTFNAALATANPMSITGGSAADVITTSAQADLVNGKGGIDAITITAGNAVVQSDALASADADLITGFVSGTNDYDYNGALVNGSGAGAGIAAAEIASAATFAAGLATGDAANDIVFIATTALAGGNGNVELAAAVAGGMTAAEATALEAALVSATGALTGSIAGLDTVLGTADSVLLVMNDATNSAVFRITNSDQSTTNTLTAAEIELVGVFAGTAALAAADFV
jgi:hypothetical protein